ncbi:Pkinase-domain-containing protein [Rhizophagus clarus]|uniref:non-specific serine/threonine protein kinase n=1 Tax=Rhizophagus clarus TaxID=94130 RepID=A0A8H3QCH7_9GLOM|nr:Pkinase-domain-containing protein [Rhizophagus clarus]
MTRSPEQRDVKELPLGVGNYIVGTEIGRGSFASVYKGYNKKTHETVAIKSVLKSKLTKKLFENLESEIQILKGIRHDHIVQLVDFKKSDTDTHIHLIMEFCSMGDLSNYIKRRGDVNGIAATDPGAPPLKHTTNGLNEYVVRHFLLQLANALEFLRSQNLIHRDIKPQNLLLQPPPTDKQKGHIVGSPDLPILKIADFGFARILPSTSLAETLCGSPLYMAPEILRYEKYDAKADLWSVGAVLYEMSVGKPPFRAQNHVDLLRKIEKGGDKIRFPNESSGIIQTGSQLDSTKSPTNKVTLNNTGTFPVVSEELKDLIRHLLKRNPVERISFEEFFMHPCVTGRLEPLQPRSSNKTLHSKERSGHDSKLKDYDIPQKGNLVDYINPLQKKASRDNRNTKYLGTTTTGITKSVDNNNNLQVNTDLQPPYDNSSPSPSLLVQKPLTEEVTNKKRIDENETLTSRSNGEELTGYEFEREYVLVGSKRTVEVNALADEFNAASPKGVAHTYGNKGTAIVLAGPSNQLDVQYRTTPPNTSTSASFFFSTTPPFALPISVSHERANSSGNSNRPLSALERALSVASGRLFGTGNSPPSWSEKYSKQKGNAIVIPSSDLNDPAEEAVVKTIEDHAHKAYVIFQFASTKFNQLLPPPPSASNDMVDDIPVSEETAAIKAEEAFGLYLRALSFLQAAMDSAKEYWTNGEKNMNYPGGKRASPRLIAAVQWVRAKFNECLDKAEYAKSRLPVEEKLTGVSVERLLYDRALEMSRQAALNELVGEDLTGCEKAYQSAIYMLNGILETPDSYEKIEKIEDDDRKIVNGYIKEINKRLSSLRKKLTNSENPVIAGQNENPG